MHIKEAIACIVEHRDLGGSEMVSVMEQIMAGQCSDLEISAFLTGLRMKGESLDEITGAARVMRALATPVSVDIEHLVDIVGTGGDGAHLFNVSSSSAFVAAASGAHVAKHGNRGVSSASGSADLLEKAGVNLAISPEQVAKCVKEVGVGFMFAPAHHSAMKNVAAARKQLGIRTLFNILGPLSNPAGVKNLVVGVFSKTLCKPLAEVFRELGSEQVMVVHSGDGLDEISLATETRVAELKNGKIAQYAISPEALGIKRQSLEGLEVDGSEASLALIKDALGQRVGQHAPKAADMIALNSGAAIYVAGVADSLAEGVAIARETIMSGLALKKMRTLATFSQGFNQE